MEDEIRHRLLDWRRLRNVRRKRKNGHENEGEGDKCGDAERRVAEDSILRMIRGGSIRE